MSQRRLILYLNITVSLTRRGLPAPDSDTPQMTLESVYSAAAPSLARDYAATTKDQSFPDDDSAGLCVFIWAAIERKSCFCHILESSPSAAVPGVETAGGGGGQ